MPARAERHLPVEMILQHWGLSARGPGAHPMGSLAQPAFIDEDDGAPLAERCFLSRGQRTRFQYRIASSSRSARAPVRWAAGSSTRAGARCAKRGLRDSAPRTGPRSVHAPGPRSTARWRSRAPGDASERLLDLPQLARAQFGLTPGPSSLLQPRPTGLRKLPRPANHRLPMDAQAPRDHLAYARSSNCAASIRRRSSPSKFRRTPAAFPIAASYHMYLYYARVNSLWARGQFMPCGGLWENVPSL